jgi:hypothetical protein
VVWRNWAGEFISSKTSNRVMMSAAVDSASLLLDRGEGMSSTAQFTWRSFGSDNVRSERLCALAIAMTDGVRITAADVDICMFGVWI